jgi:HEAT repeat protein
MTRWIGEAAAVEIGADMLEGLDAIDWAALTHAYGSAADVPGLLRALASKNKEQRENAIYELYGNIWHQGTVYAATAVAVPFLYELLASPEVEDRGGIALLLASIAAGHGYLEVHAVDEWGGPTWKKIMAEQGKSLDAEIQREAAETLAVRRAISARLPELLPYLRDPDPELRRAMADALSYYPEHSAITVPALQEVAAIEADDSVWEFVADTLKRLRPQDKPRWA